MTKKPETPNHSLSRRKFLGGTASAAALASLAAVPGAANASASGAAMASGGGPEPELRVDISHAVNAFDPDQALGSTMDILSPELVQKVYRPDVVQASLSAGWGPISYRNHTELAMQAWHWNPRGSWSQPGERGYFTCSAEMGAPIHDSFGYDLPLRGNTRVSGGTRGYSRLTDGDATTFWKSNPYLTKSFTGQDDSEHPQWIVVDLLAQQKVNAIRLNWCEPSARVYEIQYWTGHDPMTWEEPGMNRFRVGGPPIPVSGQANGRWNRFPQGYVSDGNGGNVTLKLCEYPVEARWFRVVMTQSNNRPSPQGSGDVRHRSGYALYQVSIGVLSSAGQFIDYVQHSPDQNQTPTFCSSTDPWHRASDLQRESDQTGLDLFFTSGITNRLPATIPVAVLYSTPDNAAHQVAYMKQRGYPLAAIEMGEECEGQYYMPEDYAELYIQFADAIHKAAPEAKLSGPVMRGLNQSPSVWPDAQGRSLWLLRFIDYLKRRNRLDTFNFCSFEHYPFDPCNCTWGDLLREPEIMRNVLDGLRNDGLPASVPLVIDESGVSWRLTQYMSDIFSALWLADSVGSFFLYGGGQYYHSPIQPQRVGHGCHGWASWGNFLCDDNLRVTGYLATFHASQMINREWATHGSGEHKLYPVEVPIHDAAGQAWVTAYALHRPDGQWALLIVNKDKDNDFAVRCVFSNSANGTAMHFTGPVTQISYGSAQYVWHGDNAQAHADPNLPPKTTHSTGDPSTVITLAKASITVVRGRIGSTS